LSFALVAVNVYRGLRGFFIGFGHLISSQTDNFEAWNISQC